MKTFMRDITLIASIPLGSKPDVLKKIQLIKSYLRDEVGLNVHLIVTTGKGEPKIIAMGEVIELSEDLATLIYKITSKLASDVSDPNFLDKVAAGVTIDE